MIAAIIVFVIIFLLGMLAGVLAFGLCRAAGKPTPKQGDRS